MYHKKEKDDEYRDCAEAGKYAILAGYVIGQK